MSDSVDVLFIDEAVARCYLPAVAQTVRSSVLLGDPQQLDPGSAA